MSSSTGLSLSWSCWTVRSKWGAVQYGHQTIFPARLLWDNSIYIVTENKSQADPGRTEGGQRRYGNAEAARLAFVAHARQLGFDLDAIAELIALQDMPLPSRYSAELSRIRARRSRRCSSRPRRIDCSTKSR